MENLARFIANNPALFEDKHVLELGAGCTGVVGLTAAKIGATRVTLTDCPEIVEVT